MEGLHVSTELLEQGSSAVIVEREVDLATVPEFELALLRTIAGNAATRPLSFSSTPFVFLVKITRTGRGRPVIVAPEGIVLKVLTIAKLDHVFEIYPTRAAAIDGTADNHHLPITRSE